MGEGREKKGSQNDWENRREVLQKENNESISTDAFLCTGILEVVLRVIKRG